MTHLMILPFVSLFHPLGCRIRLQLFGRPHFRGPGTVTGPAAQRQRLALLALLATARADGVGRDRVIALLWPEAGTERGRHLLCNSVYVLRRALGTDAVLAEADGLRLNPVRLGTDVGEFLDALERGDDAAAVAYCTAPFLDGFFMPGAPEYERWADCQRERLQHCAAAALERLAERAELAGDLRTAAGWWQALAALDPYGSRTALRLVRSLTLAGEAAAALQCARTHARRLREDLELEPSAELAALVALPDLRAGLRR